MKTKVLIIGDTHISSFDDLPKQILQILNLYDCVIHVGDYTSKNIFKGFDNLKPNYFKGVYANSDPLEIRKLLPRKKIIEISRKRVGIIHPESGGSETLLKKRILKEFRDQDLDIIAYGHTHEANIQRRENTLFINPGREYIDEFSSKPYATIVILTIDQEIKAKIIEIKY